MYGQTLKYRYTYIISKEYTMVMDAIAAIINTKKYARLTKYTTNIEVRAEFEPLLRYTKDPTKLLTLIHEDLDKLGERTLFEAACKDTRMHAETYTPTVVMKFIRYRTSSGNPESRYISIFAVLDTRPPYRIIPIYPWETRLTFADLDRCITCDIADQTMATKLDELDKSAIVVDGDALTAIGVSPILESATKVKTKETEATAQTPDDEDLNAIANSLKTLSKPYATETPKQIEAPKTAITQKKALEHLTDSILKGILDCFDAYTRELYGGFFIAEKDASPANVTFFDHNDGVALTDVLYEVIYNTLDNAIDTGKGDKKDVEPAAAPQNADEQPGSEMAGMDE